MGLRFHTFRIRTNWCLKSILKSRPYAHTDAGKGKGRGKGSNLLCDGSLSRKRKCHPHRCPGYSRGQGRQSSRRVSSLDPNSPPGTPSDRGRSRDWAGLSRQRPGRPASPAGSWEPWASPAVLPPARAARLASGLWPHSAVAAASFLPPPASCSAGGPFVSPAVRSSHTDLTSALSAFPQAPPDPAAPPGSLGHQLQGLTWGLPGLVPPPRLPCRLPPAPPAFCPPQHSALPSVGAASILGPRRSPASSSHLPGLQGAVGSCSFLLLAVWMAPSLTLRPDT